MFENIRLSFQGIFGHKLRSFLTMLGIIIGIAAIIAIVSTIKGTNDQIKENLVGSGSNIVQVNLSQGGMEITPSDGYNLTHVPIVDDAIIEKILDIESVIDVAKYHKASTWQGVNHGKATLSGCNIIGGNEKYIELMDYTIVRGRGFVDNDFLDFRNVVILDSTSAYGLFDVDTLRQLCSGKCHVVTPVETTLRDAVNRGAGNIAVWAPEGIRFSGAYVKAFTDMGLQGSVTAITPDPSLDVRLELRSVLRQYAASGRQLDALVLSEYSKDLSLLESELNLIREAGTEEDAAFSRMLSPGFFIVEPGTSLTGAIFRYMRNGNLFTHRIAPPAARWFETTVSRTGRPAIVEVGSSYVFKSYVQDFD